MKKTDFPVSIVGFIGVCLCAEPVYVGFVPEYGHAQQQAIADGKRAGRSSRV